MDQYEELELIGKGSFGEVWKIKRLSDSKILVWKKLDYGQMNEKEKAQLVAEVNILRDLRHAHIVRYFDRIIDRSKTRIYIIMEYCEYGDLGTLIKRCRREGQWLNEDCIWKIFSQMVQALHECHTRPAKILHRDLKPGNVFLDSSYQVKLGDFGLARVLGENSIYAKTTVGTPYYMSPEQIERSSYGDKSDIWSAGCLLYEMAALRPPFEAENQYQLAAKIRKGKFKRLPMRYSEELQRVVSWMLNVEPNLRPSVEDLHSVPQVSTRLRERRLRENYGLLKQREEYLKNKEAELVKKEADLNEREAAISRREEEAGDKPSRTCRQDHIQLGISDDNGGASDDIQSAATFMSVATPPPQAGANRFMHRTPPSVNPNPAQNSGSVANNIGHSPRERAGSCTVDMKPNTYPECSDQDAFASPLEGDALPLTIPASCAQSGSDTDDPNLNHNANAQLPDNAAYPYRRIGSQRAELDPLVAKNHVIQEPVQPPVVGKNRHHMAENPLDALPTTHRYLGNQRSNDEYRSGTRNSREGSLQGRTQHTDENQKGYWMAGQNHTGVRASSTDAASRLGNPLWKDNFVAQGPGVRRRDAHSAAFAGRRGSANARALSCNQKDERGL
eukprot:Platyproteum_vivax@DN13907_c0_g1_i1.p1